MKVKLAIASLCNGCAEGIMASEPKELSFETDPYQRNKIDPGRKQIDEGT